jgi:membrane protease YdiL (CAAX protease family)
MKKCPYCGKEYPDDVERCLIDNEVLAGEEIQAVQPVIASAKPWTDWQLSVFEIVLICTIAFGAGILSSGYYLLFPVHGGAGSESASYGIYKWLTSCVREASALGLLFYILKRQGKSFVNLGLSWKPKDIGWAIILIIAGYVASLAVYEAIYFTGLTTVSHKAATKYVGQILFAGGISVMTIWFQFLNPFFEELIVRAYLMTEVKRLTNSVTKAIIISTALQTSYHFYQGAPVAFAHAPTFLIFSIYYAKTNRIAPVILAHLYGDIVPTLLYFFHQ